MKNKFKSIICILMIDLFTYVLPRSAVTCDQTQSSFDKINKNFVVKSKHTIVNSE